jgi:Uma2 family endonuclease
VDSARKLATAADLIATEVDIELEAHEVYRPDVAGWRRDRTPRMPADRPVRVHPDWVCEVLSKSNKRNDLVNKLRVYHRHEVGHHWIVDPEDRSLLVVRRRLHGRADRSAG